MALFVHCVREFWLVVKRRKNGKNGEEKRIGGERRERKSRDERLKKAPRRESSFVRKPMRTSKSPRVLAH